MALIINAIIALSILTAVIPFANPLRSIRLRIIATPAKMPIAMDIANNVAAILGASLPAN